jgi:hypothetical protein
MALVQERATDEKIIQVIDRLIDDAIDGKHSARKLFFDLLGLSNVRFMTAQEVEPLPLGAETKIVRLTAIIESAIVSNESDVIDVTPAE